MKKTHAFLVCLGLSAWTLKGAPVLSSSMNLTETDSAYTVRIGVPEKTPVNVRLAAVLYHLVHAVAALWAAEKRPVVVWVWTAGVAIFSGTLYLLAVTNLRWLGAITPIGGVLFLIGWLMIAFKRN